MSSVLNDRDSLPRRNSMVSLPDSTIDQTRKCRIPRPERKENSLLRRSNSYHIPPTDIITIPSTALLSDCDNYGPIKFNLNRKPQKSNITLSPRKISESLGSCSSLVSTDGKNNLFKYCHYPGSKNICHCQFSDSTERYESPSQRYRKEVRRLNTLCENIRRQMKLKTEENEELQKQISELEQMKFDNSSDSTDLRSTSRSSSKTSDSGNYEMFQEGLIKKAEAVEIVTNCSKCNQLLINMEDVKLRLSELEQYIQIMEKQHLEQEQQHRQTYLEMYNKGEEAARRKHADDVLEFAHQAPDRVSVPELLQQLRLTEQELNDMKNLYRVDIYSKKTEFYDADIRLRFLKDAVYYYLTEKDRLRHYHLATIEKILEFSEREKMNIQKALLTRK